VPGEKETASSAEEQSRMRPGTWLRAKLTAELKELSGLRQDLPLDGFLRSDLLKSTRFAQGLGSGN